MNKTGLEIKKGGEVCFGSKKHVLVVIVVIASLPPASQTLTTDLEISQHLKQEK